MGFESLLDDGGGEIGDDRSSIAENSGDKGLLPALQIARRTDLFDAMAILDQERVVKIVMVHPAADAMADQRADHQRRHEREFVRHFEHNQYAGHGRSDYSAQR